MPRYKLRTLLIVLALGPMVLACVVCSAHGDTQKASAIAEDTERISVRLLGPAAEITGIEVPKDLQSLSDTYLRREHSSDITLRIPGESAVQMRVKYASINVDHGIVVDVHLLPQFEAAPFRNA